MTITKATYQRAFDISVDIMVRARMCRDDRDTCKLGDGRDEAACRKCIGRFLLEKAMLELERESIWQDAK